MNKLSLEKNKREEGEGGEVVRDALGNPTGLFNEQAMDLIEEHFPAKQAREMQRVGTCHQIMSAKRHNKFSGCGRFARDDRPVSSV